LPRRLGTEDPADDTSWKPIAINRALLSNVSGEERIPETLVHTQPSFTTS